MNCRLCTALTLLLAGLFQTPSLVNGGSSIPQGVERVHCVVPDNTTPPDYCEAYITLSNTSQIVSHFFTSNTTVIVFLPGYYALDYSIAVTSVRELRIVGGVVHYNDSTTEAEGQSVINCTGRGGFVFENCNRLTLENISLVNCGQPVNFTANEFHYAALAFGAVQDLSLLGLTIAHSHGYGLYAKCLLGASLISSCTLTHNHGNMNHGGGNALVNQSSCPLTDDVSLLQINDTQFLHGSNSYDITVTATGLCLFIESDHFDVSITGSKFIGNVARGREFSTGGNLAIFFRNHSSIISNSVSISHCMIKDGMAQRGAGIYINILEWPLPGSNETILHPQQRLVLSHVQLIENHATERGGGLYIIVHEVSDVNTVTGQILVDNCLFNNNTLISNESGGIALEVINHFYPGYLPHSTPQFNITFSNCNFSRNRYVGADRYPISSGAAFIRDTASGVEFANCSFEHNNSTALLLAQSTVILRGIITIMGNSGTNGAGMALCGGSFMYIEAHTRIEYLNNRAKRYGGGIYAEDRCFQVHPPCFYQLHYDVYKGNAQEKNKLLDTIKLIFVNNSAGTAGTAIFGGSIGNCYTQDIGPHHQPNGTTIFKRLFHVEYNKSSDFSAISSPPIGVCLCHNHHPNCSLNHPHPIIKYPGERFSISAVVVGQKSGTVPGTVYAKIHSRDHASMSESDVLQRINRNSCTSLNYTVFSKGNVKLELIAKYESSPGNTEYSNPTVEVHFKQCPPGFEINSSSHCVCAPILKRNKCECSITSQTVQCNPSAWVGHRKNVILFGHQCPYDFCKDDRIKIEDGQIDSQCTSNRNGILCGRCNQNLSLTLGNSDCEECSNVYLIMIISFVLAGFILVLLISLCNISVSEGTINGIIFYANIIHPNGPIFFRKSKSRMLSNYSQALQTFIAWLNLDLGIKTCFYNGMDAYAKAWLQFVFPVYLWLIAGLIIFFSHKSIAVSRIVGRNAVKVLATLFFLSYAKLLRAIIFTIDFTILEYEPENTTKHITVWSYDGNVDFLGRKHIPLFCVAVAFGLFTLPYSIVLTFIQCLQRGSHTRPLFWVRKLKPFFDAYTGPYKDKSRFWTGYLLLLRCAAFICFASSPYDNSHVKIASTMFVCLFAIIPAWVLGGVYRKWTLDAVESISYLNLIILSVGCSIQPSDSKAVNVLTTISVSIELLLVIAVLFYHGFTYFPVTENFNTLLTHRQRNQRQAFLPHRSHTLQTSYGGVTNYREPLDLLSNESST